MKYLFISITTLSMTLSASAMNAQCLSPILSGVTPYEITAVDLTPILDLDEGRTVVYIACE